MESQERVGVIIAVVAIAVIGIAALVVFWPFRSGAPRHRDMESGFDADQPEPPGAAPPGTSAAKPAPPATQSASDREQHLGHQERADYNLACSLFNKGRYDQASRTLSSLLTSRDPDLAALAAELKREADVRRHIIADLPLHPLLEAHSVPINGQSRVMVQRGLVASIGILTAADSPSGLPTCTTIELFNPTEDRIKPDVQVMLLNRDGVIVLEHSESWLIDTLDFEQSHTIDLHEHTEFPASLVFSKWGQIGWDITPLYALCVGSRTSYERLRDDFVQEVNRLRAAPPASVDIPYELKEVLPEAQRFQFDKELLIDDSSIVESLRFGKRGVEIKYRNRTGMRIKPNIMGHVFNRDGVIIGSFRDTWHWFALDPDERETKTKGLALRVPDELVFSRWARVAYDEEPAWFLCAGSSRKFDELVKREQARIRELNTASVLKDERGK